MCLLWILLILGKNAEVKCDSYLDRVVDSGGAELLQSLFKLKDKMSTFFQIDMDEIGRRGKIIQGALQNFFIEATRKDTGGPNTRDGVVVHYKAATTTEAHYGGVPRTKEADCLDFDELAFDAGYRSDTHDVVTDDGYVLTIHRLLPISPNTTVGKNGVVLLHHGLFGSSDDWLLLGPKKGLPYLLLTAEYDVWLTNARGNKYSRAHLQKYIKDESFWNFSWHEIGRFDLAAVIDYIRERNGDLKLHYIGYSMGATALFVLLSMVPKYNQFLKIAILIAPLVLMQNVKGPLQVLAQLGANYNTETLRNLGFRENSPLVQLPAEVAKLFCKVETINCQNPLILLAEKPISELKTKINRYTPGGGSVKTIMHYIQSITSGQFRTYDSQSSVSNTGPYLMYNLNNVVTPLIVISSLGDSISTESDVKNLLFHLPKIALYHKVTDYDFNHLDFMWSNNANIFVYYNILEMLHIINSHTINTTSV